MQHLKKILLLLLVMSLTLPMLFACDSSMGADDTSSAADTSSTESEVSDETSKHEDIAPEIKDLGGREINVLCWDWSAGSASILGFTGEVISNEEENPSSVDVAKKAVLDLVEEQYNVTFGGSVTNDNGYFNEVQNMVTSGIYSYDIVFGASGYASTQASNNYATDLTTVSTIHLENSWWDQNAVKDFSIGNKLFWVCGDINTYDNLGTWCVLFNKTMKNDLGITDDFYEKAEDGTWTMDYFMEVCQGITHDDNGDGVTDEFDVWACGTERFNVFAQVLAGGIHAVEKDDNDIPYLTVRNNAQRTYNALDKIVSFYLGEEVMVANGGKYDNKGYSNVWEATVHKAFIEGRELFYICGLINVASFRSMENEFGILPMPKTFADQDTYYHTVSAGNSSYMLLPYGVPEVEDLGLIVEALAMHSQELVTPQFYETQLKYRDTRDNESAAMLDLIFATRSFDLCPVFNWGGLLECYTTLDLNFASRFDSILDAAETAMQDSVDALTD